MRSIRRYPQTRVEADGLFPEFVDVLLIGWAAANHPESGDPSRSSTVISATFGQRTRIGSAERPDTAASSHRGQSAGDWTSTARISSSKLEARGLNCPQRGSDEQCTY